MPFPFARSRTVIPGVLALLTMMVVNAQAVIRAQPADTLLNPGDGTITGKVVCDGKPPEPMELPSIAKTDHCQASPEQRFQNCDQKWIIGKDKAVANVLVVLKPLNKQKFAPTEKRNDRVVIDIPFCTFVPHVVTVKPGQKLVITNSSKAYHDPKVRDERSFCGADLTEIMAPNTERTYQVHRQSKPLTVACINHGWMSAVIWAFDHPYSAVTDQDGNFKIDNVPTGVKLSVVAWHEAVGYFHSEDMTLQAKETKTFNFWVKTRGQATLARDGDKIRAVYKNTTDREIKADSYYMKNSILALEVRDASGERILTVPPSVPPAKAEFVVIAAGKELSISYDITANFSPRLSAGTYTVRLRLADDWTSNELPYVVGKNRE